MSAPPIGNVSIVVNDNGGNTSASVPLSSIQLKIGCAITGGSASSAAMIFATTQAPQLQANLIGGPLMEAGGLVCEGGGTCLAITCPIVTPGTATAVVAGTPALTNVGNAVVAVTVDPVNGPWDHYYALVTCTVAGTIGTAPGPSVTVSLDAGRNVGAAFSLGTATSLMLGAPYSPPTIGATGMQLGFTNAQTMAVGDTWRFSTTAPKWSQAGVQAAYAAYLRSQYAVAGVGSTHIVGISTSGSSADIPVIQTALQSGVAGYIFPRALVDLRDAGAPTIWGGSAETEAAWMAALGTSVSGLTAQPRVFADAGDYNTPSPYPSVGGATFSYRRNLAWSHAVRRTQIGLATRAGEVDLGAYSTITVNPASDPLDGFIYHNELYTPGLNTARIGSAQTWPKQGAGFYQCQEPLLSANTSQFTEAVIGNVVDATCDICYATGVPIVSSRLVTLPSGVLETSFRNALQAKIQKALQTGLVAAGLATSVIAIVNPTANVLLTSNIPIQVTVTPYGYANSITFTINLNTSGI